VAGAALTAASVTAVTVLTASAGVTRPVQAGTVQARTLCRLAALLPWPPARPLTARRSADLLPRGRVIGAADDYRAQGRSCDPLPAWGRLIPPAHSSAPDKPARESQSPRFVFGGLRLCATTPDGAQRPLLPSPRLHPPGRATHPLVPSASTVGGQRRRFLAR